MQGGWPSTPRPWAGFRAGAIVVGLLGPACAVDLPAQWIPRDGAVSALVVAWAPTGTTIEAYALGGAGALELEIAEGVPGDLLGYETPLSDLGLAPGPVALDPMGIPLPPPAWLRQFSPEASGSRVAPVEDWPTRLAELRIQAERPCPTLVAEPKVVAPTPRSVLFLEPLDDHRALLGTSRGLFLVESSTISLVRELPPGAGYTGVYRPPGEAQLYLLADDGQVWLGWPSAGFRPFARLPVLTPGTLAGQGSGDAVTLYGLVDRTQALRWRAGATETIPVELDPTRAPDVAPWGGGGLIVFRKSRRSVLELPSFGDTPRELFPELNVDDELRGLRSHPHHGATLVTRNGKILALGDAGVQAIFEAPTVTTPFVFVPAFGGLFYGGEDAVLGLVLPSGRLCGPTSYAIRGQESYKFGAALDDGVVLADESKIGHDVPLVWIRRLR